MAENDRERKGHGSVPDHARHVAGGIVPSATDVTGGGARRSRIWRSQDGIVWPRDSRGAYPISKRGESRNGLVYFDTCVAPGPGCSAVSWMTAPSRARSSRVKGS